MKEYKTEGYIPCSLRRKVFQRDGRRCRYCGSGRNLCIVHLVPVCRGGDRFDPANLGVACLSCQRKKGKKTDDEFKKELWFDDLLRREELLRSFSRARIVFIDGEELLVSMRSFPRPNATGIVVNSGSDEIYISLFAVKKIIPVKEKAIIDEERKRCLSFGMLETASL